MKIETMFCDRCGKVCGTSRSNHGLHLYKVIFILTDVHKYDEPMDLCKDCYASLAKWMKAGKTDGEVGEKK